MPHFVLLVISGSEDFFLTKKSLRKLENEEGLREILENICEKFDEIGKILKRFHGKYKGKLRKLNII